MKISESRFGEIEFSPENLIHFPEGLIGMESLRNFVVMPNRQDGPLFWIQSVEDPDIALLLTDPTNFFHDYQVVPDRQEKKKLAIEEQGECYALSIVTLHKDRSITFNLAAPILFTPTSQHGLQVILEGAPYNTRTPLPEV